MNANGSSQPGQASQTPMTELPRAGIIRRLAAIGVVIAGIAGLFAYAGGWLRPHALTPARLTDTFETVNGVHSGFRRNHAKGVCVSGFFQSKGQGVSLSKASLFQSGRVPIIGRFSLSGGMPYTADRAAAVFHTLIIRDRLLHRMALWPTHSDKSSPHATGSAIRVIDGKET